MCFVVERDEERLASSSKHESELYLLKRNSTPKVQCCEIVEHEAEWFVVRPLA